MMGWVEASSCRPYNLSAGESAMAFVRPDSAREGGSGAGLQHQHCARALKLAAQYVTSSDPLQVGSRAATSLLRDLGCYDKDYAHST